MSKITTLEGSIKRLEEIVAQMGGDLPIDEAIKLYGEAVKLIDFAGVKLDSAKLKVEKLTATEQGGADESL